MPIDRRTFMKLGGVGIFGVTFAPLLSGCEEHIVQTFGRGSTIKETPFLTPLNDFFVQNGGEGSIVNWAMPNLTQDEWKLTFANQIGPSVSPLTFPNGRDYIDYADLMQAKANGQEITILNTMQCILESPLRITPTGFTATAYWTGIPLQYFLDQVDAIYGNGNRRLFFETHDGFLNNIEIDRVVKSEELGLYPPLLVYQMNGQPLTREHGFPVRLIVQGTYGYRNIKWPRLVKGSPSRNDTGTYQSNGYTAPTINVASRATNLREGIAIAGGSIEIRGFAVSGHAPISSVEIAIDGEADTDFRAAALIPLEEIMDKESLPPTIRQIADNEDYPFRSVWTMWRLPWEARSGQHRIAIRAADAAGNVQPVQNGSPSQGLNGIVRYNITVQ